MRQIQYLCSVILEILAKMGNIKIKRGVFDSKLELEQAVKGQLSRDCPLTSLTSLPSGRAVL